MQNRFIQYKNISYIKVSATKCSKVCRYSVLKQFLTLFEDIPTDESSIFKVMKMKLKVL
jgi:hypothetical protein